MYLESIMTSYRIDLPRNCFDRVLSYFLKLGHYLFNDIALDVYGVKVLLEVWIR
jgi:hypothetical protein